MADGVARLPAVTRRTLLGGAAAAGAASLIAPAAGLAAATSSHRLISTRWLGSLAGESPPLLAPAEFALVGVEWTGPRGARIELRVQALDGRWGRWAIASVLGHDGDGQTARVPVFGEPIWTGPAERVQLRSDRAVRGLGVHFVSAPGLSAGRLAAAPSLALPVLDAGPGQPPVIARTGWAGARARPAHRPEYGSVKLAFVHHTVTPNGYGPAHVPAILRSIFAYHVYVRGFWDIAYNFVIDAYGRVWEARAGGIDMAVLGAHAGGYNAESTGVAVLGSFMNVAPSQAAIAALQQLLAWKLSLHGLPAYGRVTVVVDPSGAAYTPFRPGAHVSLPRVAGHRDGDSTDCPGNAFYHRLPAIRPQVVALAGTPAALTTIGPPTAVLAGSTVTVTGQLQLLSGQPLAGEPIELQQLGPQGPPATTIATTTTASDGTWSVPLSSQVNMIVRALHRPFPAAVADWVLLAFAPVLTLQLQSSSPLVVSGTISAAKRRITVALYPASRTAGRPLARRRVKVIQGQFSARLPVRGAGTYVVIARSRPDPSHAPGASAPLTVTIS
jgi:hypothetical protein